MYYINNYIHHLLSDFISYILILTNHYIHGRLIVLLSIVNRVNIENYKIDHNSTIWETNRTNTKIDNLEKLSLII